MGAHHISSGTKADRSTGCSLGCSTWPRGYIAGTGVGGHCHGDHSELDHLVHNLPPLLSCGTNCVLWPAGEEVVCSEQQLMMSIHRYASNTNTYTHGKTKNGQSCALEVILQVSRVLEKKLESKGF